MRKGPVSLSHTTDLILLAGRRAAAHIALMPNTKIATCCYCGTRAALVLDSGRHELSCASCGAPLHELKKLRADAVDRDAPRHRPARFPDAAQTPRRGKPPKGYKKKKRKTLGRKAAKGFLDLLDDLFD